MLDGVFARREEVTEQQAVGWKSRFEEAEQWIASLEEAKNWRKQQAAIWKADLKSSNGRRWPRARHKTSNKDYSLEQTHGE
jgi:hypothetical protein